jgi:hypothetical protein
MVDVLCGVRIQNDHQSKLLVALENFVKLITHSELPPIASGRPSISDDIEHATAAAIELLITPVDYSR